LQGSPGKSSEYVEFPGRQNAVESNARSRIYSIHSPLLSRTSRYRALLNLRAVEEILERERPDIIESSDPYQVGWKAIAAGKSLQIPVVGFYHSHFPEAYLRSSAKFLGKPATRGIMKLARDYVRKLYNRLEATLVPSERLAAVLSEWGVRNVRAVNLGVNIDIFNPATDETIATRDSLGVGRDRKMLLYVGRLAKEKNTATLLRSFEFLQFRRPDDFHLLVIGDGPQREQLLELQTRYGNVCWLRYCEDSADLARYSVAKLISEGACPQDAIVMTGYKRVPGLSKKTAPCGLNGLETFHPLHS